MSWEPLPDREVPIKELSVACWSGCTRRWGWLDPTRCGSWSVTGRSLLGADLAQECRLEAVRGTELVVSVDDPAVAEHLRWSARDLCAAVNAVCDGEVVDELTVRVRRRGA